jgi:hypothetical protein
MDIQNVQDCVASVAVGRDPSGLRPRLTMQMFVFVARADKQEPRVSCI